MHTHPCANSAKNSAPPGCSEDWQKPRKFPDLSGWLKALGLEGYAARSRKKPAALQEVLFAYHEAWG
ncbi:MAG: hypothetical protein H0T74_09725 [Rubrobacteraceae bacterium]|nr:hypothetical protein [Rubrobacteraceae bacterium]